MVWFEDGFRKPGQIQMIGARLRQAASIIVLFEIPFAWVTKRQPDANLQQCTRRALSFETPPLKPVKVVEGPRSAVCQRDGRPVMS